MSMYSVLMVDDEEDVVRAMQKKIDWESIGFRIMGYAHNGIEALDLAEQEAPDVVLTDGRCSDGHQDALYGRAGTGAQP